MKSQKQLTNAEFDNAKFKEIISGLKKLFEFKLKQLPDILSNADGFDPPIPPTPHKKRRWP